MATVPTTRETPAWMQRWLIAAGIYNLAWGALTVFMPGWLFDLTGMDPPNYPFIWQCVGMIVGVYGIGYLAGAPLGRQPRLVSGDAPRAWTAEPGPLTVGPCGGGSHDGDGDGNPLKQTLHGALPCTRWWGDTPVAGLQRAAHKRKPRIGIESVRGRCLPRGCPE